MKNSLTLEERTLTHRLISHDIFAFFGIMNTELCTEIDETKKELLQAYLSHVYSTLRSIEQLNNNYELYKMTPGDLREQLEKLVSFPPLKNVSYSLEVNSSFKSNPNVLYSALYNLAKNSGRFIDKDQGKISVSASEYSGEVPERVYTAEGTPTEGDFILLNVNDNGQGFPKDRPLKEFIKLGVSTKGNDSGFGLYYVALVCKFLRSHLTIDSEPGNTNISIYHPLDLTKLPEIIPRKGLLERIKFW